ncbi:cutinase family protein [Actinoallomurus vinaceus]
MTRRTAAHAAAAVVALAAGGVAATATAHAATCADVDVVVARGTFEPGTLGLIVGDPVYSAIQQKVTNKTTSSYPVDYPANLDVYSNPNSAQKGNADLVDHVTKQAAACPNQRFILVGYSQGANVVDNSIGISSDGAVVGGAIVATIPASIEPRVAAVLLFGNPIRAIGKTVTGTYASRTDDVCANGDPVCGAGTDVSAHLSYGNDAGAAATFAATRLSGASLIS